MTRLYKSDPSVGDSGKESLQVVDVDVLELRVPCRTFRIRYKLAEPGQFSLTTEFLLRLLRLTEEIPEELIGKFFEFSPDETRFVVDFVEASGHAEREAGRVELTENGHALFESEEEPVLFEVHPRHERFDFDLLAWAPTEPRKQLSAFEFRLPELPLPNTTDVGRGSEYVFKAFPRYFQEFRAKRGGNRFEKQTLYTIDDVEPEQRYSTLLPVTVSVRIDNPGVAETSLVEWRTGPELEDRGAIVQSCAAVVKEIRRASSESIEAGLEIFSKCVPEQVARFIKGTHFDLGAYFKIASRQAGDLRVDRPTVRTVGSIWTDANKSRFALALKYAVARTAQTPKMVFWVRPDVYHWGMTTRVQEILLAIRGQFRREPDSNPAGLNTVLVGDDRTPHIFKDAFDAVIRADSKYLPGVLEALLVPGHLAYIAVHVPIGEADGFPIPLGVLSFDLAVVARVTKLLKAVLSDPMARIAYVGFPSENVLADAVSAMEFKTEVEVAPAEKNV